MVAHHSGAYFHTGPETLFADLGFTRDRRDCEVARYVDGNGRALTCRRTG